MVKTQATSTVLLTVVSLVASVLSIDTILAQERPKTPNSSSSVTSSNSSLLADRRKFQAQELITATPNMWIFNAGQTPRIIWRDVDEVRRLGFSGPLRIRWFNARLEEAPIPNDAGRWAAWIDGTAPNGLPFRRTLTFFARPANFLLYFAPELRVELPYFPGPISSDVWQEHRDKLGQLSANMLLRSINDSEAGAIMLAGLFESKPVGREARFADSTTVANQDYHLALKLKVEGLQNRVKTLRTPRQLTEPAAVLTQQPMEATGMAPDAKAKIDAVCRDWVADTGEPFVVMVARNGVVVTHEAFGQDPIGKPIDTNYRCWVGSITKSATALVFSQFVDQKLIGLDDSLATVFPDYPRNDPHVPTFRQCFNHTSGLNGHGDFGGANNPQLENIVLNAIDVNEPNIRYSYSGMGYDLAAKAMEILAGKSFVRLYDDQLFRPLNFGDVPLGNASSEGRFTAMELGILAQLIANRGSYGNLKFFSPETLDLMLPQPLHVREHSGVEDEGIGLHWIRRLKPNTVANSKRAADQLFSIHTLGHGSLSGCIFVIDLDQQIVITQVRQRTGVRYAEWSSKFFEAVANTTKDNTVVVADKPRAVLDNK